MVKLSAFDILWNQYSRVPPVLSVDLSGKSIVIVGANAGIGLQAAKHFSRMCPSRVILACRNEEKASLAAELIAKETGFRADVEIVDLASFLSVKAFSKRLEGEPIDVLVLNAAVAKSEYQATEDGWEEVLQTNYLSTALIAFLLIPNLHKAAKLHNSSSRVVVVTSEVHIWRRIDEHLVYHDILHELNNKEHWTPELTALCRYADTKLLLVLFTRALSQHLSKSLAFSVVPTCVNPGWCGTELTHSVFLSERIRVRAIQALIGRTAEQGARQLIWAGLGPDGKEGRHVHYAMSEAYVSLAKVEEPGDFVVSKEGFEAQEKLWNETIAVLADVAPEVRAIAEQYFNN
ncbi:NAD(P)-binding protein [Trametopsis cervina]|nr:NAD(P)-binding protein [Trametopsis cervina]